MRLRDIIEKNNRKGFGSQVSDIGKRILMFFIVLFILVFLVLLSPDTRNLIPVFAQQPAQQKQQPQAQETQPVQQKSLEEERLNILKGDIQKEIEEYKKLKKEVEVVQQAQDEKKQEGLARIAKMFEAMSSEDAAKKIEKLDEDTAVIVLNSLKPKSAGKILAQIEDEKAASLSKKLLIKGKILQEKSSR